MKTKFLRILTSFLLVFAFGFSVQAQSISGTVTDENGVPLPGATVLVQGTSNGVSTDFDGNYSINASSGDTLVFSFVGYASQSVVVGSSATVNAILTPDSALEEVVVTSLGIKRNVKALGYSLTVVDGSELSGNKTTNAINALQGKVAGVMVTGSAAGAKGSSRVVIRGTSSLTGNNQPLYVVDGITINNSNLGSAGVWGGADYGDGISSINPDEIASISVLKGGAAAALYGSRASNGVILITTKNGAGQEGIGIEFNSSTQFDMLNTGLRDTQEIYGQGRDSSKIVDPIDTYQAWGPKMDGSMVAQWDGVARKYSNQGSNLEKFYRTGETYTNTIAVSSSNESSNTRFSMTNMDNIDIVPNSSLKRNSFGLNSSQKLGDKITVDVNMKYILEDQVGNPQLSDSPGNGNFAVNLFAPTVNVNDMLGAGGLGRNADLTEFRISDNSYSQNPWFAAYNYINSSEKERFIGAINARWDIKDYLYVRGRVGGDRYDHHRTNSTPWGTAYQPNGSMNETKRAFQQYDADVFIGTDNLKLDDDVSFTAFVGVGQNSQKYSATGVSGSHFIVPGLIDVKNTKNQGSSWSYWKKQINSAYGSAEIGFMDYAYLTITARNDWFSTLSLKDKVAPNNDLYTSASLSFVLSDALDLGSSVSFLKLRGGYSQVAGGADSPYALSLAYGIYGQGHLGASLGAISGGTIPNSEITPFEKNETEFGIDLRMFDNKLSIDATYYDNETLGDIVGVSASATSGYGSALANLGNISNKGIELLIKGTLIQSDDFAWNASVNYTNNTSKVVATNDTGGNISMQEPRSRNLRVTHIVGEKYGALYGSSYVRDASGAIVHQMVNGIPIPKIGPRKILGFGVAPTQLGIGTSIRYKDINASVLFEGKSGGQIYSGSNAFLIRNGHHKKTVPAGGREAGWVPTGVMEDGSKVTTSIPTNQQEDYYRRTYSIAEEAVFDSDYMRLRSLSIGYNIPSDKLDGTFIEKATITLIGRNLFFLSNSVDNIDPESAYNNSNSAGLEWFGLPVPRTIGLNVNLKF
ncbi:MAG: SusC/RagA family TonB-linked outer membrane protein [Flavobacteriaceae bacterium]|nr:SusC/RagA family TonB-linked outer membrane protein [Flavobacteriaceae bacterium]